MARMKLKAVISGSQAHEFSLLSFHTFISFCICSSFPGSGNKIDWYYILKHLLNNILYSLRSLLPSSSEFSSFLSSPSAHSEAESEDPVSLQFSQVTLPQFCVDVLQRTLSIYQDFTGLDVSSRALPLVWRVVRLIKLSISSEIWSETGLSGRALVS